jgi:transposase
MFIDWAKVNIYIKPGKTDMRKQINGLAAIVESELTLDLFGNNLFIFCNRTKTLLKILYWERNGFCLWQKRLEQDKFPWPKNQEESMKISQNELTMLLDGIDFFNAHKKLNYTSTI